MSPTFYPHSNNRQQEVTREYGRILTAAVISTQFRQLLLSNPGKAVSAGFAGEKFTLDNEACNRLAAIQASSLADFATQLNFVMSSPVRSMATVAAD